MSFWNLLSLSLIQGLTEFLPISSSAHLILFPLLGSQEDQGLAFDVAVHVGTLIAVCLYYRRDLATLGRGMVTAVRSRKPSPESQLAWWLALGTIPVCVAGLLFHRLVETDLRSTLVIGQASIVFGLFLWWADARYRGTAEISALGARGALLVGCAQALAIIPGTSRSGATMTASLFLGQSRWSAARFSFLLSIPAIALAGGYKALSLSAQEWSDRLFDLVAGAFISGLVAFLTIHYFLKLIGRIGLIGFVIYRVLLGLVLLLLYLRGTGL